MPVYVASGNFWVCSANTNHTRNVSGEIMLDPNPTYPDYGERLNHTIVETAGRSIVQWSATNPKTKKWVWEKYGPSVPRYEAQYWTLYGMQERINVHVNSGSPYVYMKENVTDGISIYNSGTGKLTPEWIRCRILMVSRNVSQAGGPASYDKSEVVFTIDDPAFNTY